MDYSVLPIAETHIRGFHASLDEVARERRYLAFLEAPPFAESEAFVRKNIETAIRNLWRSPTLR